jgi:hypothetical protein
MKEILIIILVIYTSIFISKKTSILSQEYWLNEINEVNLIHKKNNEELIKKENNAN